MRRNGGTKRKQTRDNKETYESLYRAMEKVRALLYLRLECSCSSSLTCCIFVHTPHFLLLIPHCRFLVFFNHLRQMQTKKKKLCKPRTSGVFLRGV